jgi:hypothetical protein
VGSHSASLIACTGCASWHGSVCPTYFCRMGTVTSLPEAIAVVGWSECSAPPLVCTVTLDMRDSQCPHTQSFPQHFTEKCQRTIHFFNMLLMWLFCQDLSQAPGQECRGDRVEWDADLPSGCLWSTGQMMDQAKTQQAKCCAEHQAGPVVGPQEVSVR